MAAFCRGENTNCSPNGCARSELRPVQLIVAEISHWTVCPATGLLISSWELLPRKCCLFDCGQCSNVQSSGRRYPILKLKYLHVSKYITVYDDGDKMRLKALPMTSPN